MDALHGEASFFELGRLIFHEGNQRADHQGSSAECDARQLVAERFAGPGRHNQQDVAPGDNGLTDRLLIGAKRREAERLKQFVGRFSDLPSHTLSMCSGGLWRTGGAGGFACVS